MLLVIVTAGSTVISKDVYEGDDVQANAILDKLRIENPTYAYSVVDKVTFEITQMSVKVSKDQDDWEVAKAKGTDFAINFLAKKMGLQ